MSNKIKQITEDNANEPKKFTIRPWEFSYLKSLDTVKRTNNHYMEQLMTEYLKMLSLRLGFRPEQNVEFSIDLNDDKRELTITPIASPLEDEKL